MIYANRFKRKLYEGGLAVEILNLPNGTNSGGLAISSRCCPTAYHAIVQKMEKQNCMPQIPWALS